MQLTRERSRTEKPQGSLCVSVCEEPLALSLISTRNMQELHHLVLYTIKRSNGIFLQSLTNGLSNNFSWGLRVFGWKILR